MIVLQHRAYTSKEYTMPARYPKRQHTRSIFHIFTSYFRQIQLSLMTVAMVSTKAKALSIPRRIRQPKNMTPHSCGISSSLKPVREYLMCHLHRNIYFHSQMFNNFYLSKSAIISGTIIIKGLQFLLLNN